MVGVSKDSVKSHEKFSAKHELNFPLIADPDLAILSAYGALKQKKMFGKTVNGTDRSTFLIDKDGRIARIWRGVKVTGHADEVLAAIDELTK